LGAVGGGIISVTLFPRIASDQVTVTLDMPNGTNERVTDSIITMIDEKAELVNQEFTEAYLADYEKPLFENTIRTISSSSSATLRINLLPGEERPDDISSFMVANRLREVVGPVVGVERLTFGSNSNFGGSPISVSLLGNNIAELKAAKEELKAVMNANPLLKDVEDNDPAGIKEIRLELRESAYLLGLDLRTVMNQVRAGFFGVQAQRFQRGQDEIRVWVRYDRSNRETINNLDQMRIITPTGERVNLRDIAAYSIERGDVVINHLEGKREIQISADMKDPNGSNTAVMEDLRVNIFTGNTIKVSYGRSLL
jgi:multidrug efflux pump subunit AcrB